MSIRYLNLRQQKFQEEYVNLLIEEICLNEKVGLKTPIAAANKIKNFAKKHDAGLYSVLWNGRNEFGARMASGIYFYQIVAVSSNSDSFVKMKKMMMVK